MKEHVAPRWLFRDGPATMLRYPGMPREPSQRQRRIIVQTCQSCQRWLSDNFESKAQSLVRPMTRGEGMVLNPADQDFVVRYLVKTILLLDAWQHLPERLFAPSVARTFRKTGSHPFFSIYIGCLRQDEVENRAGPRLASQLLGTPRRPRQLPQGWLGGLKQFRGLAVVWLARDAHLETAAGAPTINLVEEAAKANILRRILPASGMSINFPPPVQMTRATYVSLQGSTELPPRRLSVL